MRHWMVVLGLVACGDKEEGDGTAPVDTDTVPETDTEPTTTDTGGGNRVFIPRFANLDAHFGVDSNGQVSSVIDNYYGTNYEIPPYILVYIGSEEWEGDFSDSDNLCTVYVDVTGATSGGAWVAEQGLWYGFDSPTNAVPFSSDCDDMTDAGYDPYAFATDLVWSIGIGPLVAPWKTYISTEDTETFSGYSATPLDPAPDDDDGFDAYGYAFAVDPLTMTLTYTLEGSYYYYDVLDVATIPLAEGGVTPAYYNVISFWILELP